MDNRHQPADRQIAVLIDLENISLSSMRWMFDQIADVGRITIRRAYAEWSLGADKREQLLELGIEAIPLNRSTSSGKNASDIKLAIDAVDLLHASPVDTFVIVSSDSDFVPLVNRLRAAGKTVYGAGEEHKAPKTLVKSCDRYIYLDQGKEAPKDTKLSLKRGMEEAQELLVRALEASIDENGQAKGSKLHETMQRLDPSFNYKSYGFSTFTKFLEASQSIKLIRPRGPGDVTIALSDQDYRMIEEPVSSEKLWRDIDLAWSNRTDKYKEFIPGPIAASDAASVLSVDKLSASGYKTLQGLLNASEYLAERWQRKGNTIVKRQG
jgi:uncharacterized protein (TIGR00288 family)